MTLEGVEGESSVDVVRMVEGVWKGVAGVVRLLVLGIGRGEGISYVQARIEDLASVGGSAGRVVEFVWDSAEGGPGAAPEQVTVIDEVAAIALMTVAVEGIADIGGHHSYLASAENREEDDGTQASAEDQDQIDTHLEEVGIVKTWVQSKTVQRLATWVDLEQVAGYTVFGEASVPLMVLEPDATALGLGDEEQVERTFDGMDHYEVVGPVGVEMGGVGEFVQIDSVVET